MAFLINYEITTTHHDEDTILMSEICDELFITDEDINKKVAEICLFSMRKIADLAIRRSHGYYTKESKIITTSSIKTTFCKTVKTFWLYDARNDDCLGEFRIEIYNLDKMPIYTQKDAERR